MQGDTRYGRCKADCSCLLCRELKNFEMSSSYREDNPGRIDTVNFILRRAPPFADVLSAVKNNRRQRGTEDQGRFVAPGQRVQVNVGESLRKPEPPPKPARRDAPGLNDGEADHRHRTVVYFGDTNRIKKEPEPPPPPLPRPDFLAELKRVQLSSVDSKAGNESPTKSTNDSVADCGLGPPPASRSDLDRPENQSSDGSANRENHFTRIEVKAGATGDSPNEIVLNLSPSRADVLRIEEDESSLEDYWSLPGDTTGFKADWSFVQQWRLRG